MSQLAGPRALTPGRQSLPQGGAGHRGDERCPATDVWPARRDKSKAIVATQHSILVAICSQAQTGALYDYFGADHYNRVQPIRTERRAIRQLKQLGYVVTLQPAS